MTGVDTRYRCPRPSTMYELISIFITDHALYIDKLYCQSLELFLHLYTCSSCHVVYPLVFTPDIQLYMVQPFKAVTPFKRRFFIKYYMIVQALLGRDLSLVTVQNTQEVPVKKSTFFEQTAKIIR